MKTVILYYANIDGVYSNVEIRKVTPERAKNVLKDYPDEYFKTFSRAKKEVLNHVENQFNYWKEARKGIRELKIDHLTYVE